MIFTNVALLNINQIMMIFLIDSIKEVIFSRNALNRKFAKSSKNKHLKKND